MEEFAEGGRLSPIKEKEFIPAGTLGIGQDENIWIRKARKDGKTYWNEFLETWNYKRFQPERYILKKGIDFKARPKSDEKYGFELTYNYNTEEGGAFMLDIYDADTLLTVQKYETNDPEKFRDICIKARDTMMPNDPILKYEFSELVGKLTSAFEKGELRKEFTEEKPDTPETPQPKFEIGDYVRVVERGYVVSTYTQKFLEYKFSNPNKEHLANNGYEGYVVAVFDDSMNHNRYAIKKLDAIGEILHEFIIDEKGLELVKKRPIIGDVVYIKDTNYLYPTAPTLKEKLGFSDPNSISKANEVYLSYGIIFSKGQDFILMPIYGVNCTVLQQEVLMGIQGIQESQEPNPEPLPVEETEFTCNVDSTKINSAYVGAFYSKNKERIEKLNSEFSCKILEALVYLSDYENCGGGVQLPIQEVVEEDDLLGAIRNLK